MTMAVENVVTRDAPRAPIPPADPHVKLPAAVVAAAEKANNYYKKEIPAEPQPAPQEPQAPVVAQEPPVPAPAAPQEPQAPQAPIAPQPVEDNWEHKFKSQQGRITSLQTQLRETQAQLSDMGNELSAAVQALEFYRNQENAPPPKRLVTEKDHEEFGHEFIDVAARAAHDAISPEVEGLKQQVGYLSQTLQQQAKQAMWDALTREVPNWRAINHHPTFKSWLGLRDPFSGAIRKVLLDSAAKAADAARVVAIFKGFVAEEAASRPAAPPPPPLPAPQLAALGRQPVVSMESLAAPGRARSVPPGSGVTTDKPIYTHADIRQFYRNTTAGQYIGREAEKAAIERDMFAAQHEGRVRG